MFVFVKAYNYFSMPDSIETYMDEYGIAEMYNNAPVSFYTTLTMKAEDNTLKMWLNISEDAPAEEIEQYTGEDGTELLEQWGAYYLTSLKSQTQGLTGKVKIKVKQGDETLNSVSLTYREAKKILKEAQKEAEEGTTEVDEEGEEDEE